MYNNFSVIKNIANEYIESEFVYINQFKIEILSATIFPEVNSIFFRFEFKNIIKLKIIIKNISITA